MAKESDRLTASSVSDEIAKWAAALRAEDIPEGVRQAVANTVLDTVALSIASIDTDYGRAVIKASDTPGNCTVFGHTDRLSPYDAALINGTTGHGEDFDNTYEGCPVHTGVVIVPALFAAGEAYQLPAKRVALGLAVAIEVMCRLGAVAMKGVHTAGFHPTSILGTVAAAVGVGVARSHDAQRIRDAMGVSASMSSGIIEYLADGSWTKRMHAGWAAQSGIRAAALGGAGFMGPVSVIEGIHGLYKAFAPSIQADHEQLTEGLGERWEAANIAFKPYACGTMTQPYIDCAVRLAKRGIKPDDIEEIVCQVGEGTVHRLWEPLALKQGPPTPYAAKFSGPYTVAAGFCYGDAGLAEFTEESIRNDQVLRVASRVRFEIDPDNEYPRNYTGHVTVRLTNGETLSEYQAQMRGGAREPLDREELIKKCQANLEFGHWPGIDARQLASFADGLFTSDQTFTATELGAR
jgi:2-methylcitrate dehydratase PrpD